MTIERARVERFGAWVRVDDGTLVAVDRPRAAKLGLHGGALWDAPSRGLDEPPVAPLEAHVAVTARCPASCTGCYLDAKPEGDHVSLADLEARLDAVAGRGVFTVAFGGGEPLTHPDLPQIAARARSRGLVPVVTTSGIGLTADKARALAGFAQVNVSYDGAGDGYEAVRGFDGRRPAERAIGLLVDAGVRVGVNVVLTRESFGDGSLLLATVGRARELGAREAQLLRYKPAGRAKSLDYLERRLTPTQIAALPSAIAAIADPPRFSVRIDCALVPLLSPAFDDVAKLRALGVMGCEAGRSLEAVTVAGARSPCSFLAADDDSSARYADAPAAPCDACSIRAVCRGGCRVVARHLGGDMNAPDPECPRVRAYREQHR